MGFSGHVGLDTQRCVNQGRNLRRLVEAIITFTHRQEPFLQHRPAVELILIKTPKLGGLSPTRPKPKWYFLAQRRGTGIFRDTGR
jgi:hypothetical protein